MKEVVEGSCQSSVWSKGGTRSKIPGGHLRSAAPQTTPNYKHDILKTLLFCDNGAWELCDLTNSRGTLNVALLSLQGLISRLSPTATMGEIFLDKALGQLSSDKQRERADGLAGTFQDSFQLAVYVSLLMLAVSRSQTHFTAE